MVVPSFSSLLEWCRHLGGLRAPGARLGTGTVTAGFLLAVGSGAAKYQGQELSRSADRRALLQAGHHHPPGRCPFPLLFSGGTTPRALAWLPSASPTCPSRLGGLLATCLAAVPQLLLAVAPSPALPVFSYLGLCTRHFLSLAVTSPPLMPVPTCVRAPHSCPQRHLGFRVAPLQS